MPSNNNSLNQFDIDDILICIRNGILQARTEEDLRIRVSNCIEEKILKPLNIPFEGKYEYTLASGKRVDALYGHVIIEYKAPGKLSTDSDIQKAKEQVIKYIITEAGDKSNYDKFLGIIISDKIAFVRYDKRNNTWILRGPYEIRRESIIKLIEALRGLRRKILSAEEIAKDFGMNSQISKRTIKLLYTKLLNTKNEKTKILFEDWMRLFKQATGYDPNKFKELKELAEDYGFEKSNINYDILIFAIHTYYALIMKLIAAEIAYLYGSGRFYKSYIVELDNAYTSKGIEGLKNILKELESGGIFKKLLGIENFLEGDYFSWYVEEIDQELGDAIAEIARRLSDYEIATPQLEPEFARDLLKKLYQNLVPRDIRHNLGEYYTPDWLAELIINEVGLSYENLENMGKEDPLKPLEIRVLDPACGSGTFLILYISRLRRYAEEHYLTDTLAKYILENVAGYDLNPLAVLTARTNYLLAIADLIQHSRLGSIEIPIYLADSIMIETKAEITEKYYILRTAVGEFKIPVNIAQNTDLLRKILDEMKMCLENGCTQEFEFRISPYNLNSSEKKSLIDLYKKLLDLRRQGKDDVWIAIIRNAFAPILNGKFDYVIGNPPWVKWDNLPEQYRESSKELWEKYGLWGIKGKTGMSKVKKDLSMLFLARCFDLYLKVGGKLGFVITFTVFKTQAGSGFRNFLAKNTKIYVIHDLVTLMPFEGATNRTGAIVIEKVCELNNINDCTIIKDVQKENISSIKHVVWNGKRIDPNISLEDVLKVTKRYEISMIPSISNDPTSPWMQVLPKIVNAVKKIMGGNPYYEAHSGVLTGLDQVYYVKILKNNPDGTILIKNPCESGQKNKVKPVEANVEPDLIYPLIRGRDVKKWYIEFKDRYIIVPHDPYTGQPFKLNDMIAKFYNSFSYLSQYRDQLKKRTIKPFISLKDKIKKAKSQAARKIAEDELDKNFYILDNISTYTFAPYKVVWKNITGAITGKASSFSCAVLSLINNKIAIPNAKLMLIPFENLEEAYYVAGILNSIIARTLISSYVIETGISTHITDTIKIPKFDPNNNLHKKIADLSKKAHELAKCIYSNNKPDDCKNIDAKEKLKKVEDEIDLAVAELYGISKEELEGFKELMEILSGK
jgi:type II restriction/modification system DNA methylase subunit YeeA